MQATRTASGRPQEHGPTWGMVETLEARVARLERDYRAQQAIVTPALALAAETFAALAARFDQAPHPSDVTAALLAWNVVDEARRQLTQR